MKFWFLASLILLLRGNYRSFLQDGSKGLLLSEIYYDTPGVDKDEEWIEMVNVGGSTLDLSEVKVGDEETFAGWEGMVQFPNGAAIEPNQVIVIAQSAAGFRPLFGRDPDFEIQDTAADIPDMHAYPPWANGEVALANDGDEVLLLSGQDTIIDAVNYSESTTYFAPSVSAAFRGQSIERVPVNCDTDTAADWQPRQRPTPGEVSYQGDCQQPVNASEEPDLFTIGEIQGEGSISPYVNQVVTFRSVVTGMYEDRNSRGIIFYTIFVQDLSGFEDGNPLTSDGMAVFLGQRQPALNTGDVVTVSGQVTEFYGLTEIDDDGLQVTPEGRTVSLPPAVALPAPSEGSNYADTLESLENMLVRTADSVRVVGPTHSGCGFAAVNADSDLARVFRRSNNDSLDQAIQVLHVTDVDCGGFPNVKSGDMVAGVTGPLTFNFDRFKVVNQVPESLKIETAGMPEVSSPPTAGPGQFSIATLNLENHFDAIDDTGRDEEPKLTRQQITTKQNKLVHLIGTSLRCPTIIGIQEVENAALLKELAEQVMTSCEFEYEVSHRESVDMRGIDVALLSDPRRVEILHVQLQQSCTLLDTGIIDDSSHCLDEESPLFSRPPLQVDLEVDGQLYSVIVNHFKSKREGEEITAPRRLAQASHINALMAEILEGDNKARIIVLGDFNDYESSPTMKLMTSGSGRLTNTLLQIADEDRYSYIFDGASQLIDGILVSPSLVADVDAVSILHLNADFPVDLREDTSSLGLPYRSTDHDPSLLILALPEQNEPVMATTAPSTRNIESEPPPPSPTDQALLVLSSEVDEESTEDLEETPPSYLGGVLLASMGGFVLIGLSILFRRRRLIRR